MNKMKLGFFCLLIVAIMAQVQVDAGNNRQQQSNQPAQQGQQQEGNRRQNRRNYRRNRRHGQEGKDGHGCKGGSCGMKKSAAAPVA